MQTILITGGLGQIGTELSSYLRREYGAEHVILTDVVQKDSPAVEAGPFELLDVTDGKRLAELVDNYHVDTVMHLAALLSAVAEARPQLAYQINLGGLFQVLEVAREKNLSVFTPSSIGAFGPTTPKVTPQDTIQRPTTMYGVTKVAGELLCDYYFRRFGVDTRGVRFPGLISYKALPGGGTTDYAVEIYYKAIRDAHYTCPIAKGTLMDMMYIPDALRAVHELMEADPSKLKHRNAFNIASMSFAPEDVAAAIQKQMPAFTMEYEVNPTLQAIADSWPDQLDDSAAQEEWGWKAKYDLDTMTTDMLENLKKRLTK
ncbi:L-threonine 3-dehydrogenase [uncultured Levyella sp.]|uniref:L-threonine 3-dehydrogenase n=1 Tax=uncultured Levyella sp. TaxID=1715800 RepID=UPI00258C1506|nr:L-threonine 3-dehydrogenase [uncultured Levyella sp.]